MSAPITSSIAPKNPQSRAKKMPGTWDLVDQDKESSILEDTPTPYMIMSLQANEMVMKYNILAALCSWLTLAGYIVVPGTFTSLQNSETLGDSKGGKVVQSTVQNVPLLPLAALFCIVGTAGMCWLWWTLRQNYVWLIRQIFFPGLMHSAVGLLTTIINVTTARDKHWSITAKITVIIVGIFTGNMSVLYILYLWFLEKIKTPRDKELAKRKVDN